MNLKSKLILTTGSVLVAGGLLTGAVFAASAPGDNAQSAPSAQSDQTGKAARRPQLTQGQQDVLKQLGDLRKAAMDKLQADEKAAIDQAVKDGKITQDQADQLLKHGGQGPGMGPGDHRGGFPGGRHQMTQDELKAKLDEAVKAGKMTQEQADQILQNGGKVEGKGGPMGGFFHWGDRGDHGGKRSGKAPAAGQAQADAGQGNQTQSNQ